MNLAYEINPFQGAHIDVEHLTRDAELFSRQLEDTLAEMLAKKLQLAWLYLDLKHAGLLPVAVAHGFIYHHADPEGAQMVLKLFPDAYVPGYATHYIGAGGVVIDSQDRLLVIQEKYHTVKHYKLPGGALDPGEHISDCVIREVFEETGIKCSFLSLHCFRHWHGYRYGKSDIYFVCRLKPLTQEIRMDTTEISEAIWMPVSEYIAHPDTREFNRKIVETALQTPGLKLGEVRGYGDPNTHEMMF